MADTDPPSEATEAPAPAPVVDPPPPPPAPAPITAEDQMKAWMRREIALAASAVSEDERKVSNP